MEPGVEIRIQVFVAPERHRLSEAPSQTVEMHQHARGAFEQSKQWLLDTWFLALSTVDAPRLSHRHCHE